MRVSIKSFDFYKKLPMDLTETTTQGAILSVIAMGFMIYLFLAELYYYMVSSIYSEVMLDVNTEAQLRINFNMSFPNLQCDFAVIDILDVLGTNRGNVTKNIMKWHLDKNGERKEVHGFNKEEEDIEHDDYHTEFVDEQESSVLLVTEDTFEQVLKDYPYVFFDFYASWCRHCVRLAPTWEAFSKRMKETTDTVRVAKVDCVKEANFCVFLKVTYYPFLQFYVNGELAGGYRGDRTVNAFMKYSSGMVQKHPVKDHKNQVRAKKNKIAAQNEDTARPGCMMYGYLMVNRVPGNFHIEALSKHHNMNNANVSHVIHFLNFGTALLSTSSRFNLKADMELQMGARTINDSMHIDHQPHEAHHHYIKVISTIFPQEAKEWKSNTVNDGETGDLLRYQLIHSSQVMHYDSYRIPEAKFNFDISPMCMSVKYRERHLYKFITSALAIVGGTFTLVGIVDAILFRVLKPKMS
eukprot:30715_1